METKSQEQEQALDLVMWHSEVYGQARITFVTVTCDKWNITRRTSSPAHPTALSGMPRHSHQATCTRQRAQGGLLLWLNFFILLTDHYTNHLQQQVENEFR